MVEGDSFSDRQPRLLLCRHRKQQSRGGKPGRRRNPSSSAECGDTFHARYRSHLTFHTSRSDDDPCDHELDCILPGLDEIHPLQSFVNSRSDSFGKVCGPIRQSPFVSDRGQPCEGG